MPEELPEWLRADRVKALPIEFLWRSHIPRGMPVIIAGRPGEGKSILAASITATLTQQGMSVIFSNREDPLAQIVRPRLEAAGADLTRVTFWDAYRMLPEALGDLDAQIKKMNAKLVVLDPISAHLSASIYNDQEVRTVLSPIRSIAADNDCAFLFIHHLVKNATSGTHPLRAIGGSGGGLPGAARAVYIFAVDPTDKDDRVLAPAKFNVGEEPKAIHFTMDSHEIVLGKGADAKMVSAGKLILLGERNTSARSLLASEAAKGAAMPNQSKTAEAAAWLTIYLSLGPRPANEVHEDAVQNGHSIKTLRRAADEMDVDKFRKGGSNGAWFWQLPPGHPALTPGTGGAP